MNGWYVVYFLMCCLNGAMCGSHGFGLNTWQFWVWAAIVILSYVAGRGWRD